MGMLIEGELIEHDLVQGSDEWLAFRINHDGASEASAMLGLSKKTSRNELLRMKSSGISKEFSDWVQENILDYGHEVEAMARPIVAKQHGIRLFPMVYSRGRLSASCDGVTMLVDTGWEHKQKNEALFAAVAAGELPDEYMPQPQQCMMVTGAEKWIFTVSDGTEENMVSMEILPDPAWFERIRAGWAQFHKDLENYQHIEHAEKPQADAMLALPALFVQARGEITGSNMEEFGLALKASLESARAVALVTDQDFANAEAAAKLYRETCKKLMLAKEAMLEQTLTIGAASRMMDAWHEDLRVTALKLEKDVEREKESKKFAIVNAAKAAYAEHIADIEAETKPVRIAVAAPDFGGAMKGKRLVSAWQDAVDTALANGKIAADAEAKDIIAKLAWCKETSAGYGFLFNDLAQIIRKDMDDFKLLVTSRINQHKIDKAAEEEATRQRIQAEADAKAKALADAEIARAKAEQEAAHAAEIARVQAEERAKAQAEASAKAEEDQRAKTAEATHAEQNATVLPLAPKPTSARPTRMAIIEAVAQHYSVSVLTADEWLRAEFGQMAA